MALPISYHWRNLFVRKTTTLMTVLVIASVVGVFAYMLGFAASLRASMAMASDEHKVIVIKRGATAESNSAIPTDEFVKLAQVNETAVDPKTSEPLQSPEMLVQVSLPRLRDGGRTFANVAVRGVTDKAFAVHNTVKLTEGRMFDTGGREVIVGRGAQSQFGGLAIGDTINLGYGGDRGYKIVGVFTAEGGPLESEIWGYLPSLTNAYNRSMYSSVNLRLRPDADAKAVVAKIQGPAIQLQAQTEPDYWNEQSRLIRVYLGIAYALVTIMCIAAICSIANTMYAAVSGRTREIAMLRTIGFSGRQILTGFVLESVLLSLIGGILGCLACQAWLSFVGSTKDMFGATTFTTLAFQIRLTPLAIAAALVSVVVVGAIGALPPAVRASRVQVISALREP
jgi:putative ABC transport system permease protein